MGFALCDTELALFDTPINQFDVQAANKQGATELNSRVKNLV